MQISCYDHELYQGTVYCCLKILKPMHEYNRSEDILKLTSIDNLAMVWNPKSEMFVLAFEAMNLVAHIPLLAQVRTITCLPGPAVIQALSL